MQEKRAIDKVYAEASVYVRKNTKLSNDNPMFKEELEHRGELAWCHNIGLMELTEQWNRL